MAGDRHLAAVRREERGGRAGRDAQERDGHLVLLAVVRVLGDRPLERRQAVDVVHHEDRCRAGLLAVHRTGDPGTCTALDDDERTGDARHVVLGWVTAERDARPGPQYLHRERGIGQRGTVGDDRLQGGPGTQGQRRARETRGRVAGRDADHVGTARRRTGDVRRRTGVAGRGDDDHAGLRRVGRRYRSHRVGREVGPERHIDHVHVVVDRPLDGLDDDVGGAGTPEHPDGVEVSLRGHAGPDGPVVGRDGRRVVRPAVRLAVGGDAEAEP